MKVKSLSCVQLLATPWTAAYQAPPSMGFLGKGTGVGCHRLLRVVKNLPANAGDIRDVALIPGLERSPEEGHGNPLQYSCLENPMDRGSWWATVHRVTKSWTRLSDFAHMHTTLSQGTPRVVSSHQKLGENHTAGFPSELPEGTNPATP